MYAMSRRLQETVRKNKEFGKIFTWRIGSQGVKCYFVRFHAFVYNIRGPAETLNMVIDTYDIINKFLNYNKFRIYVLA